MNRLVELVVYENKMAINPIEVEKITEKQIRLKNRNNSQFLIQILRSELGRVNRSSHSLSVFCFEKDIEDCKVKLLDYSFDRLNWYKDKILRLNRKIEVIKDHK